MQTLALLIDAYRELNARKLFWIVLALSLVVVLIVSLLGVNERGFTVAWHTFENPALNSQTLPPELFYKSAFVQFAIPIWLTWIAAVLALVSTASVIPDFISQGAIELTLSKPISRVRLYLTKCAGALLFAFLQVLVFAVAAFFVIGIRGGAWELSIFWAVPIVTIFFAYLYCVCALIGLLTRSTLASLLLTILFWFVLFLLNTADGTLLMVKQGFSIDTEQRAAELERAEAELAAFDARGGAAAPASEGGLGAAAREALLNPDGPEQIAERRARLEGEIATAQSELDDSQKLVDTLGFWHGMVVNVKTVLPKTSETTGLLARYTLSEEDRQILMSPEEGNRQDEMAQGVDESFRSRSVAWVLGTSLAFTAVVFGFGAWRFSRRDF